MTLFTRTLLVATIVGGATLAPVTDAHAGCGGGSRRSFGYRPRITYAPRPAYYPPAPAPCTQPPVGQPIAQQPITQPVAPQQPFPQVPAQPSQQPTQQAPAANSAPQSTQPQPGSTAPANNAQLTALQALAGMSTAQAPAAQTPAAQPQRAGQVGVWSANLGNGARVQLTLLADGKFSWSATSQAGRKSTFSGSYTIGGGNLTLIRTTDNQKLAGTMTQNGTNGFNFKLAGAKDAGLNFVRA